MKFSNEQRARVIGQLETGATAAHVARQFGVNEKTVWRLRQKFATHGTVEIAHVPDDVTSRSAHSPDTFT